MSPIVEISKAPHVRAWSVAERDRQQKDMDADIVEWSVESELNTGSKLASILVGGDLLGGSLDHLVRLTNH